jgi:hypothetical protein
MGIMDLLVRTGVVSPIDEGQPAGAAQPKAAAVDPPKAAAPAVDPSQVAAIDQMVSKELASAMESAGSQFIAEWSDTLTTLADAIPDETTRFKTALSLLQKKGVSASDIVGGFDACLGALEAKDREFNQLLSDSFKKKVSSRQEAVQSLSASIGQKQAQIEAFKAEIAAVESQIAEAKVVIAAEQAKLDLKRARFTTAYRSYRAGVEEQRTRVSAYAAK